MQIRSREFIFQKEVNHNSVIISTRENDIDSIDIVLSENSIIFKKAASTGLLRFIVRISDPEFVNSSILNFSYTLKRTNQRIVRWVSLLALDKTGVIKSIPKLTPTSEIAYGDHILGETSYRAPLSIRNGDDEIVIVFEIMNNEGLIDLTDISINGDESSSIFKLSRFKSILSDTTFSLPSCYLRERSKADIAAPSHISESSTDIDVLISLNESLISYYEQRINVIQSQYDVLRRQFDEVLLSK